MNQPGFAFLLTMVLCAAIIIVSRGDEASPAPASSAPFSTHDARGVLQSIDQKNKRATIAHDAIAGYMPAMTMSFEVRDAALAGLAPGDILAFRLCADADHAWIDRLQDTGAKTALTFAPTPPDASYIEARTGGRLPDVAFVNEHGKTVRWRDFSGEALAITFIYTRCPLPNYCPLMNRNFQTAQALLAQLGAGENWHFLSVSLDPSHDTPAVLGTFAQSYEADARHWNFVTATEADLHELGDSVGLEFSITQNRINHNLRTVVVDTAGCIRHVYRGNDWTSQELAAEMRAAMAASPTETPARRNPSVPGL